MSTLRPLVLCLTAVVGFWSGSAAALPWVVTPTDFHEDGSLALDSSGRPTYAYTVGPWPNKLGYAVRQGGTWTHSTLTGNSGSCGEPDLAYAPSGDPGIGHYEYVGGNLCAYYAYRAGGAWSFERVSPSSGEYPSLAYGSGGFAAMAYLNTDGPQGADWRVEYAMRTGPGSWSVEPVATARYMPYGQEMSLAFLPGTGEPAIAYLYGFDDEPVELRTAELRFAYRSGGTWFVEQVDHSSSFVGLDLSMALDPSGNPAIAYWDSTNGNLKFAYRIGPGNWSTQVVDAAGSVGDFSSLAFMPSGEPAIAYFDQTNMDLKYAAWNGAGWSIEPIATELSAGYLTNLVFDGNGTPFITFARSGDYLVYEATLNVPEPATLALLGAGLLALRRRRRKA